MQSIGNMRALSARGTWIASLCALCAAAGCRVTAQGPTPAEKAAEEARVERAVDERLRALFPELADEISRASITRAILEGSATDPSDPDVPTAAIAAIRRGDFDHARGLLGVLVTQSEVAKAREFLSRGELHPAVVVLDRAVHAAPDSAELRIMRGDAELAIMLAENDREFAGRALDDYREAAKKHGGPRAELGASRAAHFLGENDEALVRARAGVDALAGDDLALPLAATPERVLAEATLAVNTPGEAGARAARTALFSAIARAPADAWGWRELSRVELSGGDAQASQLVAERALSFFPDDAALHDAFSTALSRTSGSAALIREYERFAAAHPKSAEAHWRLGRERLASALEALAAKHGEPASFAAAEADFVRCKTVSPARADACAKSIAVARAGLGWSKSQLGDFDGARDAFLSVEDAAQGTAAVELAPGLPSAVAGLAAVGAHYLEAKSGAGGPSLENLEKAARVFDFVHEYDRANPHFAILAASANRDAAVALEIDARGLAAARKIDEANRRLARAREMMERSLAAWKAALALTPDDPRALREAGRVLVDYLQRDPLVARGWLEHAAAIEEERARELSQRTSTDKADARELEEVQSNLSDAYRTLGVLDLTLALDPVAALAWFEKCLATGPDPSEEVSGPNGWLARCREAVDTKHTPRIQDADRWAAPVR
jgi:tetratricopeptide (TPR) repeat protein